MLKKELRFFLILFSGFISMAANAQYTIQDSTQAFTLISGYTYVVEDSSHSYSISNIEKQQGFERTSKTGNYGLTNSAYWFKIPIVNNTSNSNYVLAIANGTLDTASLFLRREEAGSVIFEPIYSVSNRYNSPKPLFLIPVKPFSSDTFYLKVSSTKPLAIPLFISTLNVAINDNTFNNSVFGIYLGIALIMFFYNFFIYITTKDKDYRDYVVYIFFLVLTQLCLQGYFNIIFGGRYPYLSSISVPLSAALVGISSTIFIKHFLNLKQNISWADKALNIFITIYVVAIGMTFLGFIIPSQIIIQGTGVVGIPIALYSGVRLQRKGFKSALYFNFSWSFFLLSVIVWILKDTGVLPFNALTNNSILIGSSLAILLLSFALADKINTYKKDKEESQALALDVSLENERIVREQNVLLEHKVSERTVELKKSNDNLETTLRELKEAESHLVESEKMASLGQLTAGIAHEINNPINFVTSNVGPLNRDVKMLIEMIEQMETIGVDGDSAEDKMKKISSLKLDLDYDYLKEEIEYLLKGITEGASRTAEIVKGLRIFSRLDEDDIKKADQNEGLNSTAVIINNLLEGRIVLEKNYSGIPLIECYPGKLNQVFLNIMTNGIYAINKRWGHQSGGKLTLATRNDEENVYVTISDNGTGMDEQTKKKLFEPFFTTKDVGEGTGLGLSIAYNTIRKHNGFIDVNSTVGEGTEFIITLPINHTF
jgi:signal transduction histidine kinase